MAVAAIPVLPGRTNVDLIHRRGEDLPEGDLAARGCRQLGYCRRWSPATAGRCQCDGALSPPPGWRNTTWGGGRAPPSRARCQGRRRGPSFLRDAALHRAVRDEARGVGNEGNEKRSLLVRSVNQVEADLDELRLAVEALLWGGAAACCRATCR